MNMSIDEFLKLSDKPTKIRPRTFNCDVCGTKLSTCLKSQVIKCPKCGKNWYIRKEFAFDKEGTQIRFSETNGK